MWAEVSAELVHVHSPLDVRVANAVRRLWSLDEEQRLREWAPGTAGPVMNAGLDGELQRLLEEVARAGSWSVAGRRKRRGEAAQAEATAYLTCQTVEVVRVPKYLWY